MRIVPANKASWDDLDAILGGASCHGGRCYAMIPEPAKDVPSGELHVGHVGIFAAAGFVEVSRPTLRRCVMRIDF